MMRALAKLGVLAVIVGASGCAASGAVDSDTEGDVAKESGVSGGALAILAGTSGTITTLASYSDGTAHPGNHSVDIGAAGGSRVWHQMDYLTSRMAGGEIDVYESHESGYCSQWYPGDDYYNGSKIMVITSIYDVDGELVAKHTAAFQHVDPAYESIGTWTWNNPAAEKPRYPEGADLVYGNGADGGIYLGTVHTVDRPLTNGPGGGLCTDGSHLHQEGDGWRAPQRRVGDGVTERYSDIHYF